jgi:hypothetical protein
MIKKIVLSLLAFIVFTFSFAPTVSAASNGTWYNQSFTEWFSKVDDSPENEIFGERYTAAQVQWVIYGLFYFLVNGGGGNSHVLGCFIQGQVSDCIKGLISSADQPAEPKGVVAFLLEDRPLSGITYVKETLRNWHLIPRAQAADTPGFGFSSLSPILFLWRASRNIAYILFVIIIVVMSFMIMFRVKISPQVVISVQSALPKIAIGLILITFSYAIAGFMVDLMYVVIGLASVLFSSTGLGSTTFIFDFMTKGVALSGNYLGIVGILALYGQFFLVILFLNLIGGTGYGIIGAIPAMPFAFILVYLAAMVLAIVFLIAAFKIMWMLIKTFANIILAVAFAPFQIALGAITTSAGFSSWLKSFAANLAVFPVTGILSWLALYLLLLSFVVTVGSNAAINLPGILSGNLGSIASFLIHLPISSSQPSGFPPLLGSQQGLYGIAILGASLSIMLILPKIVDLIQSLMAGKPFAFGTAIGEAVSPATGLASTAGIGGMNYLSSKQQASYQAALKVGGDMPESTQRLQNFMSIIRGVSAGKVK